jgi:flagellar hook protein FlgE
MDAASVALQSLHHADTQLEMAAARIAAGATSPDGANLDIVDLSTEMVALMSAQTLFEANLAALETAGQVQKSLIDTTA